MSTLKVDLTGAGTRREAQHGQATPAIQEFNARRKVDVSHGGTVADLTAGGSVSTRSTNHGNRRAPPSGARYLRQAGTVGRTRPEAGRVTTPQNTILGGTVDIVLAQGDISTFDVDAIVNAANHSLLGGGGVDGAIHRAGGRAILEECRRIRETNWPDGLPTGEAVATTGGQLPARHVIHTVGPTWAKTKDKSELLRSCYRNSLRVADELGAATVAFPLISAGIYRWPKDDAVRLAVTTLRATPTRVQTGTLVLFDRATYDLATRVVAHLG